MSNQIDLRLGRFKKKKTANVNFSLSLESVDLYADRAHFLRTVGLSCSQTRIKSKHPFFFFLQALLWIRYATPSSLRLAICLQMNEGVSRTPYFTAHIHPEKMRMGERRRVNWLL